MLEAKFDGGRFDKARWYVEGYPSYWFTTKEDAEAAIGLAGQHGQDMRNDVVSEIRAAVDRF